SSLHPNLRFVNLRFVGHPKLNAVLLEFRFKHRTDGGVFISVVNHVATVLEANSVEAMRAPAAAQAFDPVFAANPGGRHVLGRRCASVEMLVKPTVWRNKERAVFPINTHLFGRFRILRSNSPHQTVADAAERQHVRAWPMTMRALVRPGFKLG